jgi:branched-chain amino acid transport system ATP-binding protein
MSVENTVSDQAILEVKGITLRFGGVHALNGVSFEVKPLEILTIMGPNGAGKTCIVNCINGFYRPQQGQIFFKGRDITHMASNKIAEIGIARTFQNIELYTGLSVLDNLMAARHSLMKYSTLEGAIFWGKAQNEQVRHREVVEDIIDFLEITAIRKQHVGILPYGLRKRVELGRALALEPKLLLLDEPMAGMNMEEKEDIARFIVDIFEQRKIPILLIEHDMGVVMDISDRIIVLDFGNKIADGTPDEIKVNQRVIDAYLGTESAQPTAK